MSTTTKSISNRCPFQKQNDPRSGIFRGDSNGLLPRSKSQEIVLSRSLGALHRHLSEDMSGPSIYHSGYLMKRSNHPISQTSAEQQSPKTNHLVRKGPLHSPDLDVPVGAALSAADGDVFFDEFEDDQDFPLLPLESLTSKPSAPSPLMAPRKSSSSFLAESVLATTSAPSESVATLSYLDGEDPKHSSLSSFLHGNDVEEISALMAHPEKAPTSGQESNSLLYQSQPEEDPFRECFWKMLGLFGVPKPMVSSPPPSSSFSSPKQSASSLVCATEPSFAATHTVSPKRSAPIKMPSNSDNAINKTNNGLPHRPGISLDPPVVSQQGQQPPADFIDEKGHVWRAKFCILQDAVLYFYRNKEDAECPDAKAERAAESVCSHGTSPFFPRGGDGTINNRTQESLSRSPIPRKHMLSSSFIAREHGHHAHLWEKRTPLTMIGAVHNAEAEYGSHCFALLSPPRDEEDSSGDDSEEDTSNTSASAESARDKLILRAPNSDEMKDWMFQFHCSVTLFVQSLILTQRVSGSSGFHPAPQSTFYARPNITAALHSPRAVTLSHGHGRTLPRRRRGGTPPFPGEGENSILCKDVATYTTPTRRRLKQRSQDAIQWFPQEYYRSERATSASTTTTIPSTPTPPSTSQSTGLVGSPVRRSGPSPTSLSTSLSAAAAEANTGRIESQQLSIAFLEQNDNISPELSAPPDPETERPPPARKPSGAKYIPPHLRRQQQNQSKEESKPPRKYVPPHLRKGGKPKIKACPPPNEDDEKDLGESLNKLDDAKLQTQDEIHLLKLGGCADPRVVVGSITDVCFIPKKASKLKRELRADPYGYCHEQTGNMKWDIGAVSECGIRDSNEDSYLIAGDLRKVLGSNGHESLFHKYSEHHTPGLFCIFDGHLGDQAARYAAERLPSFLGTESLVQPDGEMYGLEDAPLYIERIMRSAFEKLDEEFCDFCVEDKREWESGTTALAAVLVDKHLIIANLGDARAVACRSVDSDSRASALQKDGWSRLPESDSGNGKCLWKEISETHSPSRDDERDRIVKANGWITYEEQIPIAQLHRLNLQDDDVFDILQRCFADRYDSPSKAAAPNRVVKISRVCGELAVSRALGDRDFKAAFNDSSEEGLWDSPLFLTFPDDHSKLFQGDLVLSTPEFSALRVCEPGVYEEFFLFACDGLWDVMDADDAVRVARDLLFVKKWPARRAAARLAELAVHLGSSDNITVIVVAFSN